MSFEYGILFIVSAGNHLGQVTLTSKASELNALLSDGDRLAFETLRFIESEGIKLGLRSPAEAVNAISVAATSADDCDHLLPNPSLIDLYQGRRRPSPINGQGPGFRGAIKPEIVMPGGRLFYRPAIQDADEPIRLDPVIADRLPGQLTAAPGTGQFEVSGQRHTRGTSNSAALATRTAARLSEVVEELKDELGGDSIEERHHATLVKALLVHTAAWGTDFGWLEAALDKPDWLAYRRAALRLFGYGQISESEAVECAAERVTLVGVGDINDDEAHRFIVPLPPGLEGVTGHRKLAVTLAWMSPINPSHQKYQRADLWFEPYGELDRSDQVMSTLAVDRTGFEYNAVRRGTVQHEVFQGDRAAIFGSHDSVSITVNCRSQAGDIGGSVPYGLAVSLEVAPSMNVRVYDEVRSLIRPLVRIAETR